MNLNRKSKYGIVNIILTRDDEVKTNLTNTKTIKIIHLFKLSFNIK